MPSAPDGKLAPSPFPSIAVAKIEKGIQLASNLTDVRLQVLLLAEAIAMLVKKSVELNPPEPPSQLIVPTNKGLCP